MDKTEISPDSSSPGPGGVRRSLFREALALNLALAVLLAAAAVAAAFITVGKAVEVSAKADVEAEIRILEQYREDHEVLGYAEAIDYRILPEEEGAPALYVYLLARTDYSPIVGSLKQWPEGVSPKSEWARFDGREAGAAPGAIVAKVIMVDERFPLIVGRRLVTYEALYRSFLPAFIVISLLMAGLAVFLTTRLARRFRSRVNAMNDVFQAIRAGDVKARIPAAMLAPRDELALLGEETNNALEEITRLMKGLDAVSQTAAHELNKEVGRLRQLALDAGKQDIANGADALLGLLREILELVKVETTPDADMRPMSLSAAAQSAIDLFGDAFEEKAVSLESKFETPAPMVLGRAALVTNAVANLLDNALKHTPSGGRVVIIVRTEGNTHVLTVSDTGAGADSDDLSALARRGADAGVAGYGFGLRFVQAVAIRHGARVRIKSNEPGFLISISFPASRSSD